MVKMSVNTNSPKASENLHMFSPVTVIGAGVIGISWTAYFLAKGLEVRVNDVLPDLEAVVHAGIKQIIPTLHELGLPTEGLTDRLIIERNLERALDGAAVVQENGPERIDFKQELYARIEQFVSKDTLLLSSSSGLKASEIAEKMKNPERMLIGHPFNPPHLVPLVEVVPGLLTASSAVEKAVNFYEALGKNSLVLKKEMDGFVANRLQSALFREAIHLVLEGVVSMKELDEIVTSSIGLRWAAGGPFLTFHLGGGKGGFPAFLKHLGSGMDALWDHLGKPHLDKDTVHLLTEQAIDSYGTIAKNQLEEERDCRQLSVLCSLNEKK
ncbi:MULTISPECIES: 3-hydroxyacyl-CoA dehydrogenase NAD-binding domain-containing protein [Bacillus cereus group]|uniref:3-hydroxyacyl-CoA dehydrogenase NAD-binding domain-containing protein n=1 Tax=Bacillus cereus group TaxID=86661 RepID=UPI0021D2BD4F|nr:3-hydroxyacyl-CoA dehydrogenase NAD-binding domain-containing protein [Bacillus wiedmannii]MCU5600864.1 3-hydroxyacyl-CoA dehydrogenase NAD-binding domain-containing protein [Bacillus wiedmannii]